MQRYCLQSEGEIEEKGEKREKRDDEAEGKEGESILRFTRSHDSLCVNCMCVGQSSSICSTDTKPKYQGFDSLPP